MLVGKPPIGGIGASAGGSSVVLVSDALCGLRVAGSSVEACSPPAPVGIAVGSGRQGAGAASASRRKAERTSRV